MTANEKRNEAEAHIYLLLFNLRSIAANIQRKPKGGHFWAGFCGRLFAAAMSFLSAHRFPSGNHRTGFRCDYCAPKDGNDLQTGFVRKALTIKEML